MGLPKAYHPGRSLETPMRKSGCCRKKARMHLSILSPSPLAGSGMLRPTGPSSLRGIVDAETSLDTCVLASLLACALASRLLSLRKAGAEGTAVAAAAALLKIWFVSIAFASGIDSMPLEVRGGCGGFSTGLSLSEGRSLTDGGLSSRSAAALSDSTFSAALVRHASEALPPMPREPMDALADKVEFDCRLELLSSCCCASTSALKVNVSFCS
mmetsp:Transcript_35327/g.82510  ORF Transcript_35327/g.82510 Transcript_35327/m.82510 type:complete len:213 (+) Transcript_35327:294-932(+)